MLCSFAPSRSTPPFPVTRLSGQFQDVRRHLVVLAPEVRSSDGQPLSPPPIGGCLPFIRAACSLGAICVPGSLALEDVGGWRHLLVSPLPPPHPPTPAPPLETRQGWPSLALLGRETNFRTCRDPAPACVSRAVPELRFPPACAAGPRSLPQELSAHLLRLIRQPGSGTPWPA